jgi:drug/metabolite transporter (DMT)-like permease
MPAAGQQPPTPVEQSTGVNASGGAATRGRPAAPLWGATSTSRERRLAELAVLAVTICWAGNFIVVKAAVEVLPPVTFSALRYALAAAALMAVLRWREGSVGMPRRDLVPILLLGVVGFGVYQVLWPTSLQFISAGDSALLIAATPVLTGLIAVAARSDVLTGTKLGGALVAFAGVAVVVGGTTGFAPGSSLVGDLLTLACALCWAIYTAFGAPFLRRQSPLRTTAWAVLGGTALLVPLGAVQAADVDWSLVGPGVVAGIAYSGLLAAGIANVLVFHAVRLVGPTRVTAFQFLIPLFAIALAAMFLSEPILLPQIAGGIIIIVGVAITRSDWIRRHVPARTSRPSVRQEPPTR